MYPSKRKFCVLFGFPRWQLYYCTCKIFVIFGGGGVVVEFDFKISVRYLLDVPHYSLSHALFSQPLSAYLPNLSRHGMCRTKLLKRSLMCRPQTPCVCVFHVIPTSAENTETEMWFFFRLFFWKFCDFWYCFLQKFNSIYYGHNALTLFSYFWYFFYIFCLFVWALFLVFLSFECVNNLIFFFCVSCLVRDLVSPFFLLFFFIFVQIGFIRWILVCTMNVNADLNTNCDLIVVVPKY